MDAQDEEHLEHRLLHRLIFFTDAVFAIVMTLLVLELRPPETRAGMQLGGVLAMMSGKLFAFALSFSILAIFWVAHLSTTRRLLRFDWLTAVANLGFLFPICLIPFVSAWVGEAVTTNLSWGAYSLVLILTSIGNMVLVIVQSRDGGKLIAGGVSPAQRTFRLARSAAPGVAFTIGLIAAMAGQVYVTQFCWLLIFPYMAVVRRTLMPPEDRHPRKTRARTNARAKAA